MRAGQHPLHEILPSPRRLVSCESLDLLRRWWEPKHYKIQPPDQGAPGGRGRKLQSLFPESHLQVGIDTIMAMLMDDRLKRPVIRFENLLIHSSWQLCPCIEP